MTFVELFLTITALPMLGLASLILIDRVTPRRDWATVMLQPVSRFPRR